MWTISRACRRPSPSSRRPPPRIRAPPSAPSPRSTTICACCSRGSACPIRPATGLPIESQTVSQMADRILALPEGTRLYLLAPIVRGRKGEYRKELAELQKKGFQRAKVDGKFYDIGATPGAGQEAQARYRDRGGPHRGQAGYRQPPARFHRDRAGPGRRPAGGGIRRRKGKGRQAEADDAVVQIRLPGLRLHHFGDRAAAVLLQQSRMAPARNATGWGCRIISTRRWWCPTRA